MRLIALAVIVLFTSCAFTSTEYSKSGVYVGASLIGSFSGFGDAKEDGTDYDLSSSKTSGGIGLRAGYRFLDRFAVELAYEGGQSYNFSDADVRTQSIGLQGKFFPFTGALQPYGMAGIGSLSGNVSDGGPDDTGTFFRIGVGMDMYLLPVLPLFIEFDYTEGTGDVNDIDYFAIMAGAYFRF